MSLVPDNEFHTFEGEKDVYLSGSTLFIERVKTQYGSLDLRLMDVDRVHFTYEKHGSINVMIYNTREDLIAYFDEFKKNKHVGIIDITSTVYMNDLSEKDENDKFYEYKVIK